MQETSPIHYQRHASQSTPLNGRNSWGSRQFSRGNLQIAQFNRPTLPSLTAFNIRVTMVVLLWLPSLTDAIWLSPLLCISKREELLKVQLVLERQRRSKIWERVWLSSLLSSIAHKVLTTEVWAECFQVWCRLVVGAVSMSSIGLSWRCWVWWPSRC